MALPWVHAAEDNTIRLALIVRRPRKRGRGRRLRASSRPVRLVAMADLFENRLAGSFKALKEDTLTEWMFRRIGGLWGSARIRKRSIRCGRATLLFWQHAAFARRTWNTPWRRHQRFHGKSFARSRWNRKILRLGRPLEEEPQDRRGPDVPAFPARQALIQKDPRWRGR